MTFYQILTALDSTYSVNMPASYTRWMDVFRFVGLNWSSLVLPSGCISSSFTSILLLHALTPVAVILIIFVAYAFYAVATAKASPDGTKPALRDTLLRGLLDGVPLALLISFSFVASISAQIFSSWSCEAYGSIDAITVTAVDNAAGISGAGT
jgi:hypothetical protein